MGWSVDRARVGRIVRWTRAPCGRSSTTWPPAGSTPTTPCAALARLPFADLGYARIDHHRALRQGLPEAVYGPGKTPEQCAGIVDELLGQRHRAGAAHPGDRRAGQGRRWPPTPEGAASGTHARVAAVAAAAAGAGRGRHRRHRRSAPWPTSAPRCSSAHGFRPDAAHRRRRGRAPPPPAPRRRAGRGRRRRRGGRHGGRAGQRGRRPHRGAGRGRARPAPATAPASTASPRCWRCWRRAPPASPSSASTTASARRARWPACCDRPAPAGRDHASPGSTASPASPATWRSASLLDAGADLARRCAASLGRARRSPGWHLDVEAVAARAASAPPGPSCTDRARPATTATYADDRGDARRAPSSPTGCTTVALAVFERLAAVEGAIHGVDARRGPLPRGRRRSTPSSTSSAPAPRSRCSASTRCAQPGGRRASARCAAAHGVLPNPAPAVVALLAAAAPDLRRRHRPRADHADRRRAARRAGARLRADAGDDAVAVGYGAGTPRPRRPAERRAGRDRRRLAADADGRSAPGQPVTLLEVNVDDATGEVLAHTVATLLGAGAHDAWITPIVMKKGRPAHTVQRAVPIRRWRPTLAATARAPRRARSACGAARMRTMAAARATRRRRTSTACPSAIKVGAGRVKVEHDDAAAAAEPARPAAARGAAPGRGRRSPIAARRCASR